VLRGVVNHVPMWLLLIAVVMGVVGLVLLLVWLPFSGDLSVSSEPFRTRRARAVLRPLT
jgi:hypothetical protein